MNDGLTFQRKAANPYIYWGVVAAVVLVLVVLADYPFIGQVGIGIYALVAFWRLESSQVFKLALVGLGIVLVATVADAYQVLDAFSGYVFLLFMVGVFVLGRELWRYSQALREQRAKEDNAN